jgi:hypothetical protein
MRTILFYLALLLFLLFWLLILFAWWMTPVFTPLRVNSYEYAFNLSHQVEDVLAIGLPALVSSIILMLIDLWLHRKAELISLGDKMPVVLLALALLSIGLLLSIYLMIIEHLLRGGGAHKFSLLIIDAVLVTLPPSLLLATLLGYDLRKPFLILLLPVVVGSILLKFFYVMNNLKIMF